MSMSKCDNCKHPEKYHMPDGCIALGYKTVDERRGDNIRHVSTLKCKCEGFT